MHTSIEWKKVLIVLVAVAGLVGIGIFFWRELVNSPVVVVPLMPAPVIKQEVMSDDSDQTGNISDDMAHWQVYTNEKYGFSLKYPADWKTETFSDWAPDDVDPDGTVGFSPPSFSACVQEAEKEAKEGVVWRMLCGHVTVEFMKNPQSLNIKDFLKSLEWRWEEKSFKIMPVDGIVVYRFMMEGDFEPGTFENFWVVYDNNLFIRLYDSNLSTSDKKALEKIALSFTKMEK